MSLGFPPFTPAVKWLVAVTAGIYLLQALFEGSYPALANEINFTFGLVPALTVFKYHLWQVVTYSFLHGGIFHLLFNMLALWMFGSQFEMEWGTRRFLELFYFSVIGAALITVAVAFTGALGINPLGPPTVGASGGIYGLLVAYGMIYGEREIFLMLPPISIKAKYFVFIIGFIAVASTLQGGGGVAALAHVGGLLFGYIYVKFIPRYGITTGFTEWAFGLRNRYHKYKRRQAAKKFEVFMREHDRNKYFDEHGNFRAPGDGKDGEGKGGWVN